MRKSAQKSSLKSMLHFISEAGMLKQIKRSGWSVLGIKNGESVAEHSFRCAIIGYLLAQREGACVYKVLLMTLFNDLPEARITDLHKMAQAYFRIHAAESKAFAQQLAALPKDIKRDLADLCEDYNRQKSRESIVARDADILECLIQAKEYKEQGHLQAAKFMQKAPRHLKTKSAKRLWRLAKDTRLNDWWFKLSKFKR